MRRFLIIGGSLLFVGGVIAFVAFLQPQSGERGMQKAPSFKDDDAAVVPSLTFEDYEGTEVSLDEFRGTPIVVNAWASWCPFCVEELKEFAKVQKEFGEQVVIIAINRAESKETAKRFSDDVGVTDDLTFLLDPRDEFYDTIGGFSMPETIFVDADGRIRIHKRGPMEASEIREKIQQVL